MTAQMQEAVYVDLGREFDPVPDVLTIDALETLRASWYQYGDQKFADLRAIITEMGVAQEIASRYVHQLVVGNITAYYYHRNGSYLNREKRFSESETISVFVEPAHLQIVQVCSLIHTDDPMQDTSPRIFIPGAWLGQLMKFKGEAWFRIRARSDANEQAHIAELAERMLIGRSV